MNTRHLLFALFVAGGFAVGAQAQVISYSPRTGDVWIDTELGYFNDYGRRDRVYFVDDIVGSYGAPRYLVNELLEKRRWDPGDVYYAAALAYAAKRPLSDVIRTFDTEDGRGHGWGVVAMRMGIKPGSAEFHALKGQMGKSKGRYGTRAPGNSGHGNDDHPANKGKDVHDDGPGNSGGKGKDKGGQDKGKGKDKGKSKGHGR